MLPYFTPILDQRLHYRMQGSFAPVRVLFSPFDGSKILLPFAQKTFGFYKLFAKNHEDVPVRYT